jgi:hypothetical protein
MRAFFFILFVCPVVMFSQNQQVPAANGSTDCPTFGKKNTSTKAGLFQYMRTNKPPKTEQQTVYRASALPTLKPAAEEEEAILLKKQKRAERAAARKQRKSQIDPIREEEPALAKTTADEPSVTKAMADEPAEVKTDETTSVKTTVESTDNAKADETSIENESSAKSTNAKRAEERDKKIRKAATKGKIQHIFKRTNKPSSRKNVQKCPQF